MLHSLKPGVPKRYLLFIAAFVWTVAGGILITKGIIRQSDSGQLGCIGLSMSIAGGFLMYYLMFSRLTNKHIRRILKIEHERPCLFSFFNIRSYLIMSVMIASGILLEKLGTVTQIDLEFVDFTMGIPLFLSAFKFYWQGLFYWQQDHNSSFGR